MVEKRFGDHSRTARENTNDPRGAPYFIKVREMIRKHDMEKYHTQVIKWQEEVHTTHRTPSKALLAKARVERAYKGI